MNLRNTELLKVVKDDKYANTDDPWRVVVCAFGRRGAERTVRWAPSERQARAQGRRLIRKMRRRGSFVS